MKQRKGGWPIEAVAKRVRVISDNDYAGDPDGLVQLAHHLLSPSVEIVGVIGTHHRSWQDAAMEETPDAAVEAAAKIARLCGRKDVTIVRGARPAMVDHRDPLDSEGVQLIIREAMRTDVDTPLFVCCGASLTEIASAWLIEPRIAERVTLVWIGGHEYDGPVAPGASDAEYNLAIDRVAAQVVFNDSNLRIWQIPRDVYRQALTTRAELMVRMSGQGRLGAYLFRRMGGVPVMAAKHGIAVGETYVLGDSPLVLVTALQTAFEPDTASCQWVDIACPFVDDAGLYVTNPNGRTIRVYTRIDNRLWLEDLYAKLALLARDKA